MAAVFFLGMIMTSRVRKTGSIGWIAAITALLSLSMSTSALAETIRITVTKWCSYNCTVTRNRGFVPDVVAAAFESQGHQVVFLPLPWMRALDLTRNGETDGTVAPAKAEAPDFIYPSEPVGQQQMCFFTRAEHSWHYEDVDSLKAIRLGFLVNLSLPGIMDYLTDNHGSDKVQPIADEQFMRKNFLKLDRGRIDALIDDKNVVYYYMNQQGIDPSTYRVAGCLRSEPIYLGLSPKRSRESARLAAIYDAGYASIRASGKLGMILRRYGVPSLTSMM